MKKFILYIPFFNFTKYHLFKDPGGILRGFRDLGYKSSIISGKFDVNAADMLNGIKCYETGLTYIKKPILDNAKEIIHVLKLLIKEKPDIFLFYNHSNMVVLVLIPLYRLSVIFFNLHTKIYMKMDSDGSSFKKANFVKKPFLYLLNLFLGIFIDRVIIENSCGYKVYKSIFTYNKKLKIIPNGVSDELLYNAAKFKRRPNIISVSRITPSKGIDILIKAYSNIALKFPDWKLLLVGPVEDKKYYKVLNGMIKDLGLKGRVKFLGAIGEDQLKILYLKSSIYCLCSREESFSIARLEALVLGLYVISTPAGCGSDLKKYGVKLVPYNNILKISAEIEKAIVYKNKMPPRINLSDKMYGFSYTYIAGSIAKM